MKALQISKKIIAITSLITLLASCASTNDQDNTKFDAVITDQQLLTTENIDNLEIVEVEKDDDVVDQQQLLSENTVYFDYDDYSLSEKALQIIDAHAEFLLKDSFIKVVITGHTDERGSKAYNLALGEQRAQKVARQLMKRGINKDRISIISYGEEQPAIRQSTPLAWKQNRRAEIIY